MVWPGKVKPMEMLSVEGKGGERGSWYWAASRLSGYFVRCHNGGDKLFRYSCEALTVWTTALALFCWFLYIVSKSMNLLHDCICSDCSIWNLSLTLKYFPIILPTPLPRAYPFEMWATQKTLQMNMLVSIVRQKYFCFVLSVTLLWLYHLCTYM